MVEGDIKKKAYHRKVVNCSGVEFDSRRKKLKKLV